MFRKYFFAILLYTVLMVVLVACGSGSSTNNSTITSSTTAVSQHATPVSTVRPTATATTIVQATRSGQPGTSPIIITSPTIVTGSNGRAQQVVLPDRVLVIANVSQQPGVDGETTAISMTILIKNTSNHTITNQASYFQLLGEEGDTFGLQLNVTGSFFGSIAANSTRSGTIVFQIPTAAVSATGLHLFYSPDVPTDKTLVSLKI